MRYYWLKLKGEFFRDLRIKKLRQGPRGAELTLLYQELLLSALSTDGVVPLLGMETPETELSLLLDAPEADCKTLLDFLTAHGLAEKTASGGLYLPMLENCTGSEGESAARMRRLREKSRENSASAAETSGSSAEQSDFFLPAQCAQNAQNSDTEIEKEKDIEKDSDPDTETEAKAEKSVALPEGESAAKDPKDETALPLPLESGEDFYLTKKQTAEFAALYPDVDLPEQLRAMRGWLLSNPGHRKPPEGMPRFVNGWLNKQQTMIRDGTRRGKPAAPAEKGGSFCAGNQGGNVSGGYSGSGYSSPPSYDIEAAIRQAKYTVPKVKKRAK